MIISRHFTVNKISVFILMLCTITAGFSLKAQAIKPEKSLERVFEYADVKWWNEKFNDAVLTEYIIKGLQNNYDLKTASLKIEEAREQKNIVRASELPSIGIGAVPALYKLPSVSGTSGLISLPLYADYEIDIFGKNRDKTKAMDKVINISEQRERAAAISAAGAIGSAYYNIIKLDKLIELQEQIALDSREIYDLMRLSNEAGLISSADTVNAYKAYLKSESDLIEFKKTHQKLLNLLAVLTGDTPENSVNYERNSFEDIKINSYIPDFIPSDIIENRPDYISAQRLIEKAGLDARAAKKEFLPSFNILGLLSFNSAKHFSALNWTNSLALLGGSAMLPLFTGGKRIANLKLKKNKYEQALINYQNTNIKAVQEVNDALCSLKLDNEKYIKTAEIFEAEKKNFYYTELKYKEGAVSKLDMLQKHEALLSAEKMAANDKTALFISQIGLYKASAAGI